MRSLSMRGLLAAAFAILLLPGAVAPASADELLGTRKVRDLTDHDVINVQNANLYTAVRLCVEQRTVRFRNVDVIFVNGGSQDVELSDPVQPGACTPWIDLDGDGRHIRRISLWYDALTVRGVPGIVSAYGR